MSNYHIPLYPGKIYHLFTHAVGNEILFINESNYSFFLQKFVLHTNWVARVLSYCLMPNHLHFTVRIRDEWECIEHFELKKEKKYECAKHDLSDFIMERFSNCLNSYTKSFNKVFDRKGALFIDYLKRNEVDSIKYLENLINYHHFNPVHHGFVKDPLDWKWSSVHTYFLNKRSIISKDLIIELTGSSEFEWLSKGQPTCISSEDDPFLDL